MKHSGRAASYNASVEKDVLDRLAAAYPERQQVRRHLDDYCGQDTEGMVWIVSAGPKPRS